MFLRRWIIRVNRNHRVAVKCTFGALVGVVHGGATKCRRSIGSGRRQGWRTATLVSERKAATRTAELRMLMYSARRWRDENRRKAVFQADDLAVTRTCQEMTRRLGAVPMPLPKKKAPESAGQGVTAAC